MERMSFPAKCVRIARRALLERKRRSWYRLKNGISIWPKATNQSEPKWTKVNPPSTHSIRISSTRILSGGDLAAGTEHTGQYNEPKYRLVERIFYFFLPNRRKSERARMKRIHVFTESDNSYYYLLYFLYFALFSPFQCSAGVRQIQTAKQTNQECEPPEVVAIPFV